MSRCTWPLMVPVPSARRVTLTPDFPSVTQSVADPRAARTGKAPVPARTPAARPVFKKLRREQAIVYLLMSPILSRLTGLRRASLGLAWQREYDGEPAVFVAKSA